LSTSDAIFEIQPPVAVLTFNRPDMRNAMTWAMYDALAAACEEVDRNGELRALVLRGAGNAFVAGTDIAQFQQFQSSTDGIGYEKRLDAALDRLERVTKPTIAQVHGVAAGGGCAIALCCDLRIATPDASFGIPIARTLGNCLSADTCVRMLALLGPARFKEMMFTGRFIKAPEAQMIGLINSGIVDAAHIEEETRARALLVAGHAPLTIRAIKEMTRRIIQKQRLAPGADRDLIELCYMSADFKEGVAAFLAKRPPQWSGR
jgi:enoyl-CoA hydratase